jgi:hypothetical protein
MRNFDRDLGMLKLPIASAGVLNQTMFVITADHGMSPLRRFVPQTCSRAVAAAGTTSPSAAYNTATYLWLADTDVAGGGPEYPQGQRSRHPVRLLPQTQGAATHYVHAGGDFVTPTVDASNQYLLNTLMNGHEPQVVAFVRPINRQSSQQPTG